MMPSCDAALPGVMVWTNAPPKKQKYQSLCSSNHQMLPLLCFCWVTCRSCKSCFPLSGAGFQSSSKMKNHNHFKQQVHERHLLMLQKHSWEAKLLIFDSHIICYWNCRTVRNCWQVNQICPLKNFTKTEFFLKHCLSVDGLSRAVFWIQSGKTLVSLWQFSPKTFFLLYFL